MKLSRGNVEKKINMLAETKRACNRITRINDNYFSRNILLRWIFWKRLQTILNMTEKISNPESMLDFGMGWGVLLPSLSRIFKRVYGVDIHRLSIDIAHQLVQLLDCKNVQIMEVKPHEELLMFKNGSLNCIIAADVLEHIPYFSNILLSFKRILINGGRLIVSIPTENLVYRFAKKLLRHPLSCDKHVSSSKAIEEMIKKNFVIKEQRNLFFFKVFDCVRDG